MIVTICSQRVSKDKLANLLNILHNKGNFDYIIIACWQSISFEKFDLNHLQKLNESEWGRAFGANAEARWRLDEDGKEFLCRWIFDGIEPPVVESAEAFGPTDWDIQDMTFLLWGEPLFENEQWKMDKDKRRIWYVTRIPKPLVYPLTDELAEFIEETHRQKKKFAPLGLKVRFYLQEGRPVFDRFIGLEVCERAFTERRKE